MKKPNPPLEKPVAPAKAKQPVVAKAVKAAPKKTTSAKPSQKEVKAVTPKTKAEQLVTTVVTEAVSKEPTPDPLTPQKVQPVVSKPTTATPTLTMSERVGLTAGSIWHYLSDNGPTPVTDLLAALTEDEKIIQRSIGWLAQEDKITIASAGRIETIALKA